MIRRSLEESSVEEDWIHSDGEGMGNFKLGKEAWIYLFVAISHLESLLPFPLSLSPVSAQRF